MCNRGWLSPYVNWGQIPLVFFGSVKLLSFLKLSDFNSLAPGRCGCNLELVISKLMSRIDILRISWEIGPRWTPQDLTDDQSTLVQVMAWCRQATSDFLNQCWPSSMMLYGVIRPQWVNFLSSDKTTIPIEIIHIWYSGSARTDFIYYETYLVLPKCIFFYCYISGIYTVFLLLYILLHNILRITNILICFWHLYFKT